MVMNSYTRAHDRSENKIFLTMSVQTGNARAAPPHSLKNSLMRSAARTNPTTVRCLRYNSCNGYDGFAISSLTQVMSVTSTSSVAPLTNPVIPPMNELLLHCSPIPPLLTPGAPVGAGNPAQTSGSLSSPVVALGTLWIVLAES